MMTRNGKICCGSPTLKALRCERCASNTIARAPSDENETIIFHFFFLFSVQQLRHTNAVATTKCRWCWRLLILLYVARLSTERQRRTIWQWIGYSKTQEQHVAFGCVGMPFRMCVCGEGVYERMDMCGLWETGVWRFME